MRQETRNPAPTAGKSLVFGEGDMFEELAKSGTLSGGFDIFIDAYRRNKAGDYTAALYVK